MSDGYPSPMARPEPLQLQLRIRVHPMPSAWNAEPRALDAALQSGRDGFVRGTETADGVVFDVVVGVLRDRDGAPDFKGPLVHGGRGDRFLYLGWGAITPGGEHHRYGRLKLYLTPVVRQGWSSPGITWAQIEAGSLSTSVDGRGRDGTPLCGTAPLRWT